MGWNQAHKAWFQAGLQGEYYPTVAAAYEAARQAASSEDMIYIGGSTFVVAEVI